MANPYLASVFPEDLPDDPMTWAEAWLDEASAREVQRNPNSMTLVTVAENSQPSARVVLCKSFVADPGFIVFYTNYLSRKVKELESNPSVAVTFHWDALGRQIRMEGSAVFSPAEESDEYFATRDWGSQIGAWGSDQSAPIKSREALKDQVRARAVRFGINISDDMQSHDREDVPRIPRPPHWGGIRIWPTRIELWIEGSDRIHDRAVWSRTLATRGKHDFDVGPWGGERLQP